MRAAVLVLVAAVATLLGACELRIAVELDVDRDGGGTFTIHGELDEELTRILEEAGMDVLAGIDDLRRAAAGWTIVDERTPSGGISVSLRAGFDDADEFLDLSEGLRAALDDEDPTLYERLRLDRRPDGAIALSGRIGLLLPSSPGARGEGIDEEAVARLLEEHAADAVAYDLRVTLPTEPVEHDGDVVDGRSVTWQAPIGSTREITAVSAAPGWPLWVRAGLVALLGAALALLVVGLFRRLRARARA